MTAVIIALLTMTVAGLPLTIAIDRTARGRLLVGLAFLYGSGATMFALILLSVCGIEWTAATAMAALLSMAVVAWLLAGVGARSSFARRLFEARVPVLQGQSDTLRGDPAPRQSARGTRHALAALLPDLVTALLLLGYLTYATIAALWDWDFWAIWGLKGRVFFEYGGIDWRWLETPWNAFAHPDYPLLVPLNYDFAALLNGGWSDRWLGLFSVAWAVAVLLLVRELTAREVPPWMSAVATAGCALTAMSLYVGRGEGAMIAFAGAGLLLQRRALDDLRAGPADQRHAALLLGLAANCKNEGIALLAATAIAIVVADPRRWRRVLRLWPSLLLLAPWMLLRAAHTLPTDIVSGSVSQRIVERLGHFGEIGSLLTRALIDPWSWVIVLATFLLVPQALRRERFIVVVTFIQLAFYVLAYFATPHDLKWHILTSWPRLPRQVQLPITAVCALLLAQFAWRGEDAPHAEARSDQQ